MGKGQPGSEVCVVPVTLTQPAAHSTAKIAAINSAPNVRPKPKSNHQSRRKRKPKSAKGRRSRKRPASATLASTAGRVSKLFHARPSCGSSHV